MRFTHIEAHAIAVSFIYEQYGRAIVGRGRKVWRANYFPPGRMEELVAELIGAPPPRERDPHAAYHAPIHERDDATDAELIAMLLAGENDDWDTGIAADVQSAELRDTFLPGRRAPRPKAGAGREE